MQKIFRGMQNGAETIQANLEEMNTNIETYKSTISTDIGNFKTQTTSSQENFKADVKNQLKNIDLSGKEVTLENAIIKNTVSETANFCNGVNITFERKGNVVSFSGFGVTQLSELKGWTDFDGIVPLGYRPNSEKLATFWCANTPAVCSIKPSGIITNLGMWLYPGDDKGFSSQIRFFGSYITNDDFPG